MLNSRYVRKLNYLIKVAEEIAIRQVSPSTVFPTYDYGQVTAGQFIVLANTAKVIMGRLSK